MTDIEIWKTAVYDGEPYEGFEVSNWGRIKSLNYNHTGKPELMNPVANKYGYLVVHLSKNREYKMCRVHRLVAETFIPNPDNLPQVNHIDENKENNRVDNLEWKSPKGNCNHGTRNERISDAQINDPNKSKRVLQFTLDGEFVREWPSICECGRNGFSKGNVWSCCNGKKPQYKGFLWMYADEQLKEVETTLF